jgi:hypothetical protein
MATIAERLAAAAAALPEKAEELRKTATKIVRGARDAQGNSTPEGRRRLRKWLRKSGY